MAMNRIMARGNSQANPVCAAIQSLRSLIGDTMKTCDTPAPDEPFLPVNPLLRFSQSVAVFHDYRYNYVAIKRMRRLYIF